MANKVVAYIGLGSNLNKPKTQIKQALLALQSEPQIKIRALSKLYKSKPLLNMSGPDYYNAVTQISTDLSPAKLLTICQKIELQQHRTRERKWGARTIDLDILLYGNQVINTKKLTIPHPQIPKRAFVLLPIADIDPQLFLPTMGQLSDMIRCIDKNSIKRCN